MDEHLAQGGCSDGRGIGYEGLRTSSVSQLKLPTRRGSKFRLISTRTGIIRRVPVKPGPLQGLAVPEYHHTNF